uniref:Cobalt ECF transporter T component CbiQ n=1 Tax=Archaeoglobus fulgidus TaxID=2234 RepID=A0A7J2TL73_ARCFL
MHLLLERTLKNASEYFQNFLIHEYSRKATIREIDARIKFLSAVVFVLLAVSTFDLKKLLFLLFSVLTVSAVLGLSLKELLKRVWLFTAFSFFIVLPFFFSNPVYPFIFATRVFISLLSIQMLVMSTNFYEICSALKSLKVPETFVKSLWIAYSHIVLMFRDLMNIMLARESRRVAKGNHREIWKRGGEALGLFFLRSMERAEIIQMAMTSRGEKVIAERGKFGIVEISYIAIVAFISLWWITL